MTFISNTEKVIHSVICQAAENVLYQGEKKAIYQHRLVKMYSLVKHLLFFLAIDLTD